MAQILGKVLKLGCLGRALYSTELAVAAHMEIASPSIKDAVAHCVQEGCHEVIVAPYFLSQGRHIQQDIPALVAEAQAEHPNLRCIIADPIGADSFLPKRPVPSWLGHPISDNSKIAYTLCKLCNLEEICLC